MASEEEKAKKIAEYIKKIKGDLKALGEEDWLSGLDLNKLGDADAQLNMLKATSGDLNNRLREANAEMSSLAEVIAESAAEMQNSNSHLSLTKKAYSSIATEARKLKLDAEGTSKLDKKQLETSIQRLKTNNDLLKQGVEKLKNEADFKEINGKRIALTDKEIAAKKALIASQEEEITNEDGLIRLAEARLKDEKEILKVMGLTGSLLKGVGKLIENMGFSSEITTEALKATREEAELSKNSFKAMGAGISSLGKGIITQLKDPLFLTGIAAAALGKALLSVDKASGELAKNMGISYSEAIGLRDEANKTAQEFGDIMVSSEGILKAQSALQEHFQMGAKFSMEMAAEFASIQKRTGLSDKAMGLFARTAMQSNTTIKDNLKDINKTVLEQNKQNKTAFTFKEIQEAVGNTSARTRLIFKGNVKEIANAVMETKKLGVEMSQLNSIADSLLQFESSIASELEAELITGRQLNLEQARSAALRNDMVGLAQELKKQNIDAASFQAMNRIAQEATAKALGMSVDGMAEMLENQQKLNLISSAYGKDLTSMADVQEEYNKLRSEGLSAEEAATKLGDKSLSNQLESISQAEKFEAIMTRIQEIFVGLATPILNIVDGITKMVGGAENLAGIVKFLMYGYGAIQATKVAIGALDAASIVRGVIKEAQTANELAMEGGKFNLKNMQLVLEGESLGVKVASYAIALKDFAVQKAKLVYEKISGAIQRSNLLKGIADMAISAYSSIAKIPLIGPILGIAAAAAAATLGYSYLSKADDMISPGYGKRTILSPEGAIALNDEDTIVAGTNLGGGKGKKESPIPTLNLNPVINVLKEQNIILNKILDKNTDVHMDGNKVGTQLALSNPRMQ